MGTPEIADALLRALATLASCGAAGLAWFRTTQAGTSLATRIDPIRFWIGVALLLQGLHLLAQPARYTGSLGDSLEPAWLKLALLSPYGAGLLLRVVALLLIGLSLRQSAASARFVALPGLLLLATGFSLTGHVSASEGITLPVVLSAHVAVFTLWWGSLLGLDTLVRSLDPDSLATVLRRFSGDATRWFPLLPASGAWLAISLLGGWPETLDAWTVLLLAKLTLFAAAATLAALNRWRWTPRLDPAVPDSLRPLRIAIRFETAVVAAIVMLTVAMTTWTSPT